jgi:hypothetical protein
LDNGWQIKGKGKGPSSQKQKNCKIQAIKSVKSFLLQFNEEILSFLAAQGREPFPINELPGPAEKALIPVQW